MTSNKAKVYCVLFLVTDIQNPGPSPVLQEAEVDIIPFSFCQEAYKNAPFAQRLSNNLQICAGSLSGAVDSCAVSRIFDLYNIGYCKLIP